MRKRSWLLLMAVLLGLASITAQAAKPAYDNLIVFGDSYCDVGNIFLATGGAEPPAPYFAGRFSNGPIWLDHVAFRSKRRYWEGPTMRSAGHG